MGHHAYLQAMRGLMQQPEPAVVLKEVEQRAGGPLGGVEAHQALTALGIQLHPQVRPKESAFTKIIKRVMPFSAIKRT